MAMERFTISINESDIDLFERVRTDMNMNKSSFIRFLLAEHENKVPSFIKDKEIIKQLSELNTYINELLISEDKIDDIEKLYIHEKLQETNELIKKYINMERRNN